MSLNFPFSTPRWTPQYHSCTFPLIKCRAISLLFAPGHWASHAKKWITPKEKRSHRFPRHITSSPAKSQNTCVSRLKATKIVFTTIILAKDTKLHYHRIQSPTSKRSCIWRNCIPSCCLMEWSIVLIWSSIVTIPCFHCPPRHFLSNRHQWWCVRFQFSWFSFIPIVRELKGRKLLPFLFIVVSLLIDLMGYHMHQSANTVLHHRSWSCGGYCVDRHPRDFYGYVYSRLLDFSYGTMRFLPQTYV